MEPTRNNAGRIEEEMKQLGRDMTVNSSGALAARGVILSEKERTKLQRVLHEFVTGSVEIEAALAMIIEQENGPEAA